MTCYENMYGLCTEGFPNFVNRGKVDLDLSCVWINDWVNDLVVEKIK